MLLMLSTLSLVILVSGSDLCTDPATQLWHTTCQSPCTLCTTACTTTCQVPACLPACPATACSPTHGDNCQVDRFVGSHLIHEDDTQRVWNFTLEPGQMTSMHRHDLDYTFVVIRPSQLEVFGEDGRRLFDFWAEGTKAFRVEGDLLAPLVGSLPWPVPRIHSARNIGTNTYNEILFETKIASCPLKIEEE